MPIQDLNKIRWATDPGRTSEPPTAKKDEGFVDREAPSPLNLNWSFNKVFERFKSLQGGEKTIIIGLQATIDDFAADYLIADMTDANIADADKLGILEGTHILAANLALTRTSLEFQNQSDLAVIDLDGLYTLTLSGAALKGSLKITGTTAQSIVISGLNVEGLSLNVDDPAAVDFQGSGYIVVNGKLISKELTLLEISNQPDHVFLTASEQALYSNDPKFLRFDQTAGDFQTRDNTTIVPGDGSWIVIKSMETLTQRLIFVGNKLRIESHKGFEVPLGNQGNNIPYAIFIQGNNCLVDMFVDKSIPELATVLGDDKYTPMSNSLTAMENRRVFKNQGRNNRVFYNREMVFSGGTPKAHMDFVQPNHPYLLSWDSYIYDGLERDLPGFPTLDTSFKCLFTDLYYWLDRRFNAQLVAPDATLAYNTVTMPSREARFMRPAGLNDPDRHARTNLGSYQDITLSADYTQSGDKIILQNNAARDIKNVKNGERIEDAGGALPGGNTGTTLVRPGSIVTTPGSESFRLMNAEDYSSVITAASGNLTLDFSGMAASSLQAHALENLSGSFSIRRTTDDAVIVDDFVTGSLFETYDSLTNNNNSVAGSVTNRDYSVIDFDASRIANTADETRPGSILSYPFYVL